MERERERERERDGGWWQRDIANRDGELRGCRSDFEDGFAKNAASVHRRMIEEVLMI